MIIRIASIQADQYNVCKEYGLWGDERNSVGKWDIGDLLLFKVGEELVSIAEISGSSFQDDLIIWNNGFYPHRIPIKIIKEFSENSRTQYFEELRNLLLMEYGKKYGWVILNKHPLKDSIVHMVINKMLKS